MSNRTRSPDVFDVICLALLALLAFALDPFAVVEAGINSSGNAGVVPAPPLPAHGTEVGLDAGQTFTVTIGLKRCAYVSCSAGCRWVGAVGYPDGGADSPATSTDSVIHAGETMHPCAIGSQTAVSFYAPWATSPNVAVDPQ